MIDRAVAKTAARRNRTPKANVFDMITFDNAVAVCLRNDDGTGLRNVATLGTTIGIAKAFMTSKRELDKCLEAILRSVAVLSITGADSEFIFIPASPAHFVWQFFFLLLRGIKNRLRLIVRHTEYTQKI